MFHPSSSSSSSNHHYCSLTLSLLCLMFFIRSIIRSFTPFTQIPPTLSLVLILHPSFSKYCGFFIHNLTSSQPQQNQQFISFTYIMVKKPNSIDTEIKVYIALWQRPQNTPTASLQRSKTPTRSVLDMTLNNMMTNLKDCWSFGEWGVLLRCLRSQVHSCPQL